MSNKTIFPNEILFPLLLQAMFGLTPQTFNRDKNEESVLPLVNQFIAVMRDKRPSIGKGITEMRLFIQDLDRAGYEWTNCPPPFTGSCRFLILDVRNRTITYYPSENAFRMMARKLNAPYKYPIEISPVEIYSNFFFKDDMFNAPEVHKPEVSEAEIEKLYHYIDERIKERNIWIANRQEQKKQYYNVSKRLHNAGTTISKAEYEELWNVATSLRTRRANVQR